MRKIAIGLCALVMLVSCQLKKVEQVSIGSLNESVESYIDKTVEVEGMAAHICGVDQHKLKLIDANNSFIKVVVAEPIDTFPFLLHHKDVKFTGVVKELQIMKESLDAWSADRKILCHVDYNPCTDEGWIKKQEESGKAESISESSISSACQHLNENDYVSVPILYASSYEIIEK